MFMGSHRPSPLKTHSSPIVPLEAVTQGAHGGQHGLLFTVMDWVCMCMCANTNMRMHVRTHTDPRLKPPGVSWILGRIFLQEKMVYCNWLEEPFSLEAKGK